MARPCGSYGTWKLQRKATSKKSNRSLPLLPDPAKATIGYRQLEHLIYIVPQRGDLCQAFWQRNLSALHEGRRFPTLEQNSGRTAVRPYTMLAWADLPLFKLIGIGAQPANFVQVGEHALVQVVWIGIAEGIAYFFAGPAHQVEGA